ncbi:MAG TPA: hypothetical protein VIK78_21030, partial [Ruminiclostridium sp.]
KLLIRLKHVLLSIKLILHKKIAEWSDANTLLVDFFVCVLFDTSWQIVHCTTLLKQNLNYEYHAENY